MNFVVLEVGDVVRAPDLGGGLWRVVDITVDNERRVQRFYGNPDPIVNTYDGPILTGPWQRVGAIRATSFTEHEGETIATAWEYAADE